MRKHLSGVDGHQVTDADQHASEVARQLHSFVQKVCISAIEDGADNIIHVLMILSQAASGVLHLLARASASADEESLPISSTAALFSALLSYHVAPYEQEPGRVVSEFSPIIIYDALKDVEKLSGQQPDERLNATMCRVARQCAADPSLIAEVSRDRAMMHRDGATLN